MTSRPPVRPRPLRDGDRVAVLAPSSPVFEEPLGRGLEELVSWGYEVVEGPSLRARRGHLAGDDAARAADLRSALDDPDIKAVFAGRGGYGAQRVADGLDWDAFRREPTLLVGFSDFCALLHAAWERARVVGVHAQLAGRFAELTDEAAGRLRRLLRGEPVEPVGFDASQVVVAGSAEGPLVGGNLAMICAGIGTRDELRPDGAILFLEDVNEAPYSIDRMLTQLRRVGMLQRAAGVAVATWVGCDPPVDRPSGAAAEVVADRLGDLGVPVVTGLPLGHSTGQLAVPHGMPARLETGAGRLEASTLTD